MLNYLKKLVVEIFPSVAATVIGGYIVNHYIITKPAPPAAAVSIAVPKAPAEAKPAEKPAELSNLPEAGVKAKGISERTLLERTASEKATVTEKPVEKPAVAPEARRDANDLARAAIERLRGKGDASRTASDVRVQESSRVAAAPAIRPLPPPIMVSAPPSSDAHVVGSQPASADDGGPRRPTPPADIPLARLPLDLHAGSMTESSEKERMTLGEEMLSSMKSVFHAVLPKQLP